MLMTVFGLGTATSVTDSDGGQSVYYPLRFPWLAWVKVKIWGLSHDAESFERRLWVEFGQRCTSS